MARCFLPLLRPGLAVRGLAVRGLAVLGLGLCGLPASAQVKVPVEPMEPDRPADLKPGPLQKRGCIEASAIAGAVVIDPMTLELADRQGRRFRLIFARPCPHLGFYGGFYYVPDARGKLCASRDQLMGRSGAACPIAAVSEMRPRR